MRPFTHITSRDIDERYLVLIRQGDLRVYDALTGLSNVVEFPDGKDYLTLPVGTDGESGFRAVTIADTTILVNRHKTPLTDTDLSTDRGYEALCWVDRGDYGTTYSITIEGTSFEHTTSTSDVTQLSTAAIAEALYDALTDGATGLNAASVGSHSSWVVQRENSAIYFRRGDSAVFEVDFFDDRANGNMSVWTGEAERLSELPLVAKDGMTIQISGQADSSVDNYYVTFEQEDPTLDLGRGFWRESRAENIRYKFDATTMPHVLQRQADNTFIFQQATWGERVAGDEDSAPDPTFVNSPISDVLFYKNRLGFLSDDSVILSRAGEFFDFFPSTVQQLEDGAPIDVSVSNAKVSILDSAASLNDDLILFTDQMQFRLTGEPLLTPSTVSITPTTQYETNLLCRPIQARDRVYFTVSRGGDYSGVMEYSVASDGETHKAFEISSHVPKYLPGTITQLVASTNENIVVAMTPADPSSLYVYKYYFSDNDGNKLQSSWSKWTFTVDAVVGIHFVDSQLYVIMERDNEYDIEVIDVYLGQDGDVGLDHLIHLDSGVYVSELATTPDYTAGVNTFTLPYALTLSAEYIAYDPNTDAAYVLTPTAEDATTATYTGADITGVTNLLIGVRYNFQYQFSTLYARERLPGGGQLGVVDGRLQLHRMLLNYADAREFEIRVTPQGRSAYTYSFSADALSTGTFQYPILTENTQAALLIQDDSVYPLSFHSAVWEGRYYTHTRRI